MKIRIILLLILLYITKSLIYGQELNKITGIPEKGKLTEIVYNFKPVAFYSNTFTYLLLPNEESIGKYGHYYRAEQYDNDMNLLKRVQIDLKDGKEYNRLNELIYFQGKLNLFTSKLNETERKVQLFHQTMNLTTLELNNDIKVVAEFNFSEQIKNFRLQSGFEISEDGNNLLIYAYANKIKYIQIQKNVTGKIVKENRHFLYVFDNKVNLMWKREANVAIQSGFFLFEKYYLNNNGDVFITGKNFKNEDELNGLHIYSRKTSLMDRYFTYVQPSNYKQGILYFNNSGSTAKQFNLEINEVFAKSMTIYPTDNYLFCAGVYSPSNTISAKGVYTCTVNLKNGATINLTTKVFERNQPSININEKDLKKFHEVTKSNERDPFSYALSKLNKTKSGDFIFIAEQQLNGKLESNNGQMLSVYPTYNFNNLYTIWCSSTGKINSIQEVEKTQFGLGDKLHSYNYLIENNKLHLILNSMPKSTGLMKVAELENTSLISVDKEGNKQEVIITAYDKPGKKTVFMQTKAVLPLPESNGFIYPLQSLNYRYRTYAIARFK